MSHSRGVGGGPKILWEMGPSPVGWGVSDPWKHAPPHMCYHRKFGRSRSNWLCVITEILWKRLTIRVLPFKVTQGHWNPSAFFILNEKSARRRRKHCALAVVRWSQKFRTPHCRPLPGGEGRPKFNQLEMVTTFTYKPSLVRIDARNFELSW